MQRIWYVVIILAVMLPILYFIGFAMNDLLKDIRKKKDRNRQNNKVIRMQSKQGHIKRDVTEVTYLRAVK